MLWRKILTWLESIFEGLKRVQPIIPSIALATLALGASGCPKFGNHSEDPKLTEWKARELEVTGFYHTQLQKLVTCALLDTSANPICSTYTAPVDPAVLPSLLPQIFTDPVILKMMDGKTGESIFFANQNAKSFLPIYVLPDERLRLGGSTSPEQLFRDPNCTLQYNIDEMGTRRPFPEPDTDKTVGRIELTIDITIPFSSSCSTTFTEIKECISDASLCRQSSVNDNLAYHEYWIAYFGPYIDAQLFTLDEMPHLQAVGYEAQLQ